MKTTTPQTYTFGAGTRLSSAYTQGRKGLPCPRHSSVPSSAAFRAWQTGHREWAAISGSTPSLASSITPTASGDRS